MKTQSKDEQTRQTKKKFWNKITSKKSPSRGEGEHDQEKDPKQKRMFSRIGPKQQEKQAFEGGNETLSHASQANKKGSKFKVMIGNFNTSWSLSPLRRAKANQSPEIVNKDNKIIQNSQDGQSLNSESKAVVKIRKSISSPNQKEAASPPGGADKLNSSNSNENMQNKQQKAKCMNKSPLFRQTQFASEHKQEGVTIFARPSHEIAHNYDTPDCSGSQQNQSVGCQEANNVSSMPYLTNQRMSNAKKISPSNQRLPSKNSSDKDSSQQSKRGRNTKPTIRSMSAGSAEQANGPELSGDDQIAYGRTNSDNEEDKVDTKMRTFRESILKHNENLRVSIIKSEMQEYDDDLVENMINDQYKQTESPNYCMPEQEGGEQDQNLSTRVDTQTSKNTKKGKKEKKPKKGKNAKESQEVQLLEELEPTPSIHNVQDRREGSNIREDTFSQDGKKIIRFSSKRNLRDDKSQDNGGLNTDINQVNFENSQVLTPLSVEHEEKSVSQNYIYGMQEQRQGDSSTDIPHEDLLQPHRDAYQNHKKLSNNAAGQAALWNYEECISKMQSDPIKGQKFNHSIDPEGQNHLQFDTLIQVSENGKILEIWNKKPLDNPDYIVEAKPDEVKRKYKLFLLKEKKKKEILAQRQKHKEEFDPTSSSIIEEQTKSNYKQIGQKKFSFLPTLKDTAGRDDLNEDDISIDEDELNQINEEDGDEEMDIDQRQEQEKIESQYVYKKSSASAPIEDIQGIIFGGISSRFWIYRKHLCCMSYDSIKKSSKKGNKNNAEAKIPFYAWQCITLQFKHRYVDLVIKNDASMNRLLRFLIMSINTIDGQKNSAEKTFQRMVSTEVINREKMLKKTTTIKNIYKKDALVLSDEAIKQIKIQKRKLLCQQTYFKYILMKIRCKIGFQAYQARMSINELIISQINDSYEILTENGDILPVANYTPECVAQFDEILDGDFNSCMQKLIQHNLDTEVRRRKDQLYRQKELRTLGLQNLGELNQNPAEVQTGVNNLFSNNIAKLLRQKDDNFQKKKETKGRKHPISEDDSLSRDSTVKSEGRKPTQATQDIMNGLGANLGNNFKKSKCAKLDNEQKEKEKKAKQEAAMSAGQNFQNRFGLFDKSKCIDIFANVKVDGMQMYDNRSTKAKFHYKVIRKIIEKQLIKVRFMLAVGGLIDIFYIKCMLRKISLMKKMFVLELEQGQEVFIPKDLTCDNYPISYHYYDPIIQIVNHFFSAESRLYFTLKTQFNLSRLKEADWQKQMMIKLGVYESEDARKLTYKHSLINVKEQNELKHTESQHAMSLQKSRYLLVESNADRLHNLADFEMYQSQNFSNRAGATIMGSNPKSIEDMPLNLRFCHKIEVNDKRQKFVHFKQCFLVRQDHLKHQGQKFHSLVLMHRYIEKNIDELYENRPKGVDFMNKLRAQQLGISEGQVKKQGDDDSDESDESVYDEEELRAHREQKIQKEKRHYAEYLLGMTEEMVKQRRLGMRRKSIKLCYSRCDKNVDFAVKNAYLEEKIEATQKYFNYMNDFHHPGQDLQKIRKQLYKVSKRVRKAKTLSQGGNMSQGNMSRVEESLLQKKHSAAEQDSAKSGQANPALMQRHNNNKKQSTTEFAQWVEQYKKLQTHEQKLRKKQALH